ncbi:MAG: hypothetical protein QNJ85_14900 [Gammaproteobacteria bacterium]|nr:hypothetical protein [Gammaproteobacteria bacterium]
MNNQTLSEIGLELASELNQLSEQFHVKSDARDILGYEAATVEEEARDLIENCGVSEHLRKSTLLSKWGDSILHQLPDSEIIARVREFHANYRKQKNA